MKIGIISNKYKDKKYIKTRSIIKILNESNIKPFVNFKHDFKDCLYERADDNDFFDNIDYLIVIGGDGTLLGVSSICALKDIPVLVINLGTLGYLANVEQEEIEEALKKFINNDFTIDERSMIESTYVDSNNLVRKVALNDFVVTKGINSKIVSLKVTISNNKLGFIRGDGLIISTPTGSTAYNLSAGGPILMPSTNAIIITPICAQTPSFPMVISADEEIKIKVTYRSSSNIALSCDGKVVKYIKSNDELTIKRASERIKLIKVFEKSHFDVFHKKYFHEYTK